MDGTARACGTEVLSVIGRRLRSLRQDSHLSQREAAEAIGLPQSNLSRIENGKQRLNLAVLARMLELFDLSMGDFFAGTSPAPGMGPSAGNCPREQSLLVAWRQLPEEDRRALEEFAAFRLHRLRGRRTGVLPEAPRS